MWLIVLKSTFLCVNYQKTYRFFSSRDIEDCANVLGTKSKLRVLSKRGKFEPVLKKSSSKGKSSASHSMVGN